MFYSCCENCDKIRDTAPLSITITILSDNFGVCAL